jgi:predicted negative regulator of RcsB-dependent stress response
MLKGTEMLRRNPWWFASWHEATVGLILFPLFISNAAWGYQAQGGADTQVQLSRVISTFNDTKNFKSGKERYERTIAEAQKVKAKYGSSPAGQIAQYYIALSEENLGHTPKAVQDLLELIETADPTMKALAQFALGDLYKNHGEKEKAMEIYNQLDQSAYSKGHNHSRNSSKTEAHSGAADSQPHH